VITIDPNGFAKAAGGIAPYGTIIGNVAVGKNPIGIDVISRLGYAVVANSGDTPNGTASIIDISNPESPQIVPITTTSGTTTANSVNRWTLLSARCEDRSGSRAGAGGQ